MTSSEQYQRHERLLLLGAEDQPQLKEYCRLTLRRASNETRRELVRFLLNSNNPSLIFEYFSSEEAQKELKEMLETLPTPERLRLQLVLDYKEQLEIFYEFGVLEEGETSYEGDYIDPNEPEEEREVLRYEMPTLEEMFTWLTPDQLRLYEEMEKAGS